MQTPTIWRTNPILRFFSSVQLAMCLLGVLIAASVAGTLFESGFDAKVARHYIYEAPWFNFWLILLAANLAGAAFSRWPWKKHHTGFLVTHLGIITLLAGALIGKIWGIEGTMTLNTREGPNDRLVIDRRLLQVVFPGRDGYLIDAELLGKAPTEQRPKRLAKLDDGSLFEALGHAGAVAIEMAPRPVPSGGAFAAKVAMRSAMMGQSAERWLFLGVEGQDRFDLGLASIRLEKGTAPASASPGPIPARGEPADIEEGVFAFGKISDQIGRAIRGGLTGAKVRLIPAPGDAKGAVEIRYADATAVFPISAHLGKAVPVEGTPLTLDVKEYWPDFRMEGGRPTSAGDEPNNPAVFVLLTGRVPPVEPEGSVHVPGGAGADPSAPNELVLYVENSGSMSYALSSRKNGRSSGRWDPAQPLPTGWADWAVSTPSILPSAIPAFEPRPLAPGEHPPPGTRVAEGIRIRATSGGTTRDAWVPLGWPITLPLGEGGVSVTYGYRQKTLPISLKLTDFEVSRNEGSDSPAGFKSTILVTDPDSGEHTGQCWMNNPLNHPDDWRHTWSGLTYKISQASWNPEDLGQSTVQILRDPGWGLKWVGSIMVVAGISMMFYVPGFRREGSGRKTSEP